MRKSVWIFLLAVLLPSVVLGWLALRSAEEQQIVFERRTAELYQKETEALAVTVRDTVEAERRVFGETVHRLLANGDAAALARDFTNTLTDAWPMKAVGFAINKDGQLVSPSVTASAKNPQWRQFLHGNGSFLSGSEPAMVYNWQGDNQVRGKADYSRNKSLANNDAPTTRNDELQMKTGGKDVQLGLKAAAQAGGKLASSKGAAEGLLAQDKAGAFADRGVVIQTIPAPMPTRETPADGVSGRALSEPPMNTTVAEPQQAAGGTAAPARASLGKPEEKSKSASASTALDMDTLRRKESAPAPKRAGRRGTGLQVG